MKTPLISSPSSDVTELVDQYNHSLSKVLDTHAPVTRKEVLIRPHSPWYNEELAEARKKRRQAERRYMKSKLQGDLDLAHQERTRYNNMCKSAKAEYYHEKIDDCGNDTKKMFQITDSLMKGSRERVLPSHECPEMLSNDLVGFFSDKVKKISNMFPAGSDGGVTPLQTAHLTDFQPVTAEQVRKIILSGNSKSCSLDPIPTKLLKECLDRLLPSIVNIINLSISSSTVPQSLKAATVTPLLKKAGLDADDFKNYRPVSNLPYLSKIIEKCIVAQLKFHMETNNLDENHQSAYRKNHSTETALLKISNDLLCAMDKSRCSILVMLDQSAAFDTVNQDILMQRFQSTYGITGSAHAWLDSYFRHRT